MYLVPSFLFCCVLVPVTLETYEKERSMKTLLSGGSLHDNFGSYDVFGGAGEPCPPLLVSQRTGQGGDSDVFHGFGSVGGRGYGHHGHPLKLNPPFLTA